MPPGRVVSPRRASRFCGVATTGGGLGRVATNNAAMVLSPSDGAARSPNPVVDRVGVR